MPRTSTCGDWSNSKTVCKLLPPGPEQSWLIMTLRRDWPHAEGLASNEKNKSKKVAFVFSIKVSEPQSARRAGRPLLPVRGPRHKVDIKLVEFFGVDIELHVGQAQVGRNVGGRVPEEGFPVTGAVIDVDVHVKLLLASDDA